ncbi:hypothetical protein [Rubritalea tangerina]
MFTDRGLEMVSGAQPRSAVGCSVLLCKGCFVRGKVLMDSAQHSLKD